MAAVGLTVDYGQISGNATRFTSLYFVKLDENIALLNAQIQIPFTLDIKSGNMAIGSDGFDMTVGADIVVEEIDVDEDLQPGEPPQNITIDLRNVTTADIENAADEGHNSRVTKMDSKKHPL